MFFNAELLVSIVLAGLISGLAVGIGSKEKGYDLYFRIGFVMVFNALFWAVARVIESVM